MNTTKIVELLNNKNFVSYLDIVNLIQNVYIDNKLLVFVVTDSNTLKQYNVSFTLNDISTAEIDNVEVMHGNIIFLRDVDGVVHYIQLFMNYTNVLHNLIHENND